MDKMPAVAPVSDKLYEYHMSEEARHPATTPANPPPDPRASGSRGLDAQKALHSQYVLQLLQLQRRAGFLCDITIHVRDKSFKAHKLLLAACSLYFRALFSDVSTKDSTALNLNSLTPAGFEILLEYIYSGSLAITSENSSEVLSAATCLQMTNVVETCLNFMRSSFRMSKNASAPATNGIGHPSPAPIFSPRRNDITVPLKQFMSPPDPCLKPQAFVGTKNKDNFFQDNLQILSTSSINEDEFRSMVGRSFSQSRTTSSDSHSGSVNGRTSTTPSFRHQSQSLLPSTSQLQSVLPFLIENNAVQPTPEDVQRILSKLPSASAEGSNARRLPEQQPPSLIPTQSFHNSIHSNKGTPWTNKKSVNGPQQSIIHSQVSEFHPIPSTENMPRISNAASRSTINEEGTGLDLTTMSAGAKSFRHTPEHYSGANQTVYRNADETVEKESRSSLDADEFVSVPSSDDQDMQSVEISDAEDDHGGRAWSTDRSEYRKSTTDLSGTPCSSSEQRKADDGTVTSNDVFTSSPSVARKGLFESIGEAHEKFMTSISDEKPLTMTLRRCTSLPPTTKDETSSVNDNESFRSDSAIPSETTSVLPLPQQLHSRSTGESPITPTSDAESKPMEFRGLAPESLKCELEDGDSAFPVQEVPCSDPKEETGTESVLDLSACTRKRSLDQHSDNTGLNLKLSRTNSVPGRPFTSSNIPNSDPGMQLAADALSLLRQSHPHTYPATAHVSPPVVPQQQDLSRLSQRFPMPNEPADDAVTYSRKPRRTTGGQTCTWPGCGRLFRHRNIYEEHQRLHELGIPVSQLRKCYMGARVKKTVREQLEELRTEVGESDSIGQQKGRKRKSVPGGQETIRKRVTIKDRMDPLQVYSNVVSRNPLDGRLPSSSMFTHPSQLHSRIAQQSQTSSKIVPSSVQMICPSSNPNFATSQHLQLSNHGASQLVQVMGADGVVRLLQSHSSPIIQQREPAEQCSTTSNQMGAFNPMVNADRAPRSVDQPTNSQMNPVEATLALLGIPTPVRRGDHSSANAPLSGLSLEQIRRRLALRETSDNVSCSMLPLAGGPPLASSGHIVSSFGQSLASLVSESAIRPGNVTGTAPCNNLVGSAFSAARSSGAPHATSNGDNAVVSIPNQYPVASPTQASHPGTQV